MVCEYFILITPLGKVLYVYDDFVVKGLSNVPLVLVSILGSNLKLIGSYTTKKKSFSPFSYLALPEPRQDCSSPTKSTGQ